MVRNYVLIGTAAKAPAVTALRWSTISLPSPVDVLKV
jgi:hypothetical protein